MSKKVEASLVWWNNVGWMKYRVWELEQEVRQERNNNTSTVAGYPVGGSATEAVTRWVKKTLLEETTLTNDQWSGSTKAEAEAKLDQVVAPYVTEARPKRTASDV